MSQHELIAAFDPGKTTGIVCVRNTGGLFCVEWACSLPWPRRFETLSILTQWQPDVIVVESFALFAHKSRSQVGSHFPSSQFIGIIEAYAHELGMLDRIVYQTPAQRTGVKILAEHKPALKGADAHIKDAYKHARYYLLKQRHA